MRITKALFILLLISSLFCRCTFSSEFEVSKTNYDKAIKQAESYLQAHKSDSAYYYFNKALQSEYNNDAKIYALLQIAGIQQQLGDYSGCEETATQAYKNNKSSKYSIYINNILGIAFLEQNNFQDAIKHYNEVLDDSISALDRCIIQNNKAVVYLEQNKFQKAIEIEEKIIQHPALKADKKQWAKAADNLGFAYLKTGNDKALIFLKQAEIIRDSINDDFEKIASYIHLAQFYQNKNALLATTYARKGYQSAKNINSPDDKIEALHYWLLNAPPEQAKSLAVKQMKLSDSINKVRQSAKNQFAKIKYDSSKAVEDKNIANRITLVTFFLLIFVGMIGVGGIFFIKYLNRIKLKQSIYITETRIAKKIHDELANDVFQALMYAETQDLSNAQTKEIFLDHLDIIYTLTRDIANANSEIDTGTSYHENLFDLISSFNCTKTNVLINASEDLKFDKIKKETKIAIHRVLQELLVNMKKHSKSTLVVISISFIPKIIKIKYSDNGQGFKKTTINKKGLKNVENRIFALKGTITFDSQLNSGLKINMTLPR
ncbi:tetratricopeptide repeat-containing sensor histidine kinase [Flavobacterium sp.]